MPGETADSPGSGPTVLHDPAGRRFYVPLPNGAQALLSYDQSGEALDFNHTWVPPEFRNQGLAERVVEAGFRWAQEQNLKVLPTCPYVALFLRRHPDFQPLISRQLPKAKRESGAS